MNSLKQRQQIHSIKIYENKSIPDHLDNNQSNSYRGKYNMQSLTLQQTLQSQQLQSQTQAYRYNTVQASSKGIKVYSRNGSQEKSSSVRHNSNQKSQQNNRYPILKIRQYTQQQAQTQTHNTEWQSYKEQITQKFHRFKSKLNEQQMQINEQNKRIYYLQSIINENNGTIERIIRQLNQYKQIYNIDNFVQQSKRKLQNIDSFTNESFQYNQRRIEDIRIRIRLLEDEYKQINNWKICNLNDIFKDTIVNIIYNLNSYNQSIVGKYQNAFNQQSKNITKLQTQINNLHLKNYQLIHIKGTIYDCNENTRDMRISLQKAQSLYELNKKVYLQQGVEYEQSEDITPQRLSELKIRFHTLQCKIEDLQHEKEHWKETMEAYENQSKQVIWQLSNKIHVLNIQNQIHSKSQKQCKSSIDTDKISNLRNGNYKAIMVNQTIKKEAKEIESIRQQVQQHRKLIIELKTQNQTQREAFRVQCQKVKQQAENRLRNIRQQIQQQQHRGMKQNKRRQEMIGELEGQIRKLKEENKRLKEQIQRIENESIQLRKQTNQISVEFSQEFQKMHAESKLIKQYHSQLQEENIKLQTKYAQVIQNNVQLNSVLEQKTQIINQLNNRLNYTIRFQKQLHSNKQTVQLNNQKLKECKQKLQKDNQQLKVKNEKLVEQITKLQNQNQLLKTNYPSAKNNYQLFKYKNQELKAQNQQLKNQNLKLKSQNKLFLQDNQSLKENIQSLKVSYNSLQKQNKTLKQQKNQVRQQNIAMQNKFTKYNQIFDQQSEFFKKTIQNLKFENSKLKQQCNAKYCNNLQQSQPLLRKSISQTFPASNNNQPLSIQMKLNWLRRAIIHNSYKQPLTVTIDETGYLKPQVLGTYIMDEDGNTFQFTPAEVSIAVKHDVYKVQFIQVANAIIDQGQICQQSNLYLNFIKIYYNIMTQINKYKTQEYKALYTLIKQHKLLWDLYIGQHLGQKEYKPQNKQVIERYKQLKKNYLNESQIYEFVQLFNLGDEYKKINQDESNDKGILNIIEIANFLPLISDKLSSAIKYKDILNQWEIFQQNLIRLKKSRSQTFKDKLLQAINTVVNKNQEIKAHPINEDINIQMKEQLTLIIQNTALQFKAQFQDQ